MAELIETLYDDLAFPRIGKDCVVTTSTFIPLPNHIYYIPLIKGKTSFDGQVFGNGIAISKNKLNLTLKHPSEVTANNIGSFVDSNVTTSAKLLTYYQSILKDLYYKFVIYVHAGSKGCSYVTFNNFIWSVINGENGVPALTPGYIYRVECEWLPFIQSFIANKDSKNKVGDNAVEGYFKTNLANNSYAILENLRRKKTANAPVASSAMTVTQNAISTAQTTQAASNTADNTSPKMNAGMGANWYTPLTIKLTDDPKYYVSNAGHEAGAVIYGKVTEYARVIRLVSHIKSDIVETLYYRMSTDKSQTWKKIGTNALKQDGNTKEWYYDITVKNPGDYVEFWNKNSTFSKSENDFVRFNLRMLDARGVWECSGNVQSLLNYQESTSDFCFYCLFAESSYMTTAPLVPSTTLTKACYEGMFQNCWKLEEPPKLPATTMAERCYRGMFSYCHFMSYTPDLPATTMANYCYENMFLGCSLISEAALPATKMAVRCYAAMFKDCGSLWHLIVPNIGSSTNRYALPATELADSCYQFMFENCGSLTEFPYIKATTPKPRCCYGMFHNCAALDYQVRLEFTDISTASECLNYMFQGCKKLHEIGVKFTKWTTSGSNNTLYWLDDTKPVTSSTSNIFYGLHKLLKLDGSGTYTTASNGSIQNGPTDLPGGNNARSYIPAGWLLCNKKNNPNNAGTLTDADSHPAWTLPNQ